MAIDLTKKALNIQAEAVQECEKLMTALEKLEALENERASAGIVLANYDDDFTGEGPDKSSAYPHADASVVTLSLTSIATILAWMRSEYHIDNLNRLRP